MTDLRTRYLGLQLAHPFLPGSSPLAGTIDGLQRLEDAGAPAVVLPSLFEEKLRAPGASLAADGRFEEVPPVPAAEADEYMQLVAKAKERLGVPVIASLNGVSPGPWLEQARLVQQAGADALELNVYAVATDLWDPPQAIERRIETVFRTLKALVSIPVAVKLPPSLTSVPYLASQLEDAGADGLVLFNRFLEPDVDLERRQIRPVLRLSDPSELLPRLHAVALLSGRTRLSLAVSGGVQTAFDALKAVACGADAVQVVSALYRRGAGELRRIQDAAVEWLTDHGFAGIDGLRGSMSLLKCPDPKGWQRHQYLRLLSGETALANWS